MLTKDVMFDQIQAKFGRKAEHLVENFSLYASRKSLARTLVHIDLFKRTLEIPGSIVECGVFRGTSALLFAKLLDIFMPHDLSKRVIGFDTFEGFPTISEEDNAPSNPESKVGGFQDLKAFEELKLILENYNSESFYKDFERIIFVKGDLTKTAPVFLENNPELRISLLHLDLDIYEPTLSSLELFYSRVVRGGVIIIDDYGDKGWPGPGLAIEKFFAKQPMLYKFPHRSMPGAYFIKGD
jgi:hypothetical protein